MVESLGITHSMIYRWRKKYSETGEKTAEAVRIEDLRQLQKRIAELEEENEILKKASAYFAKHQR